MPGESNIAAAEFCSQILAVLLLFSLAKEAKLYLWPTSRLPNHQVNTLVWPKGTSKQHRQTPGRAFALADRKKESSIDAVIPNSRLSSAALAHQFRQIPTIPIN